MDPIPDDVLPKGFGTRSGKPPPKGTFASWLATKVPVRPACIIVRYKRHIRIFRVWRTGEVFTVTARAIKIEDRKRLVQEGILRKG
jgi:hypothetical protein